MEPLASFGNSKSQTNTNLSTSISLSIFDQNGNEISFQTNENHPIRLFIPRYPNIRIPSMNLQNVTSMNSIRPLNQSLAYLVIYKFDQTLLLNSSINLIDEWKLFCPSILTNESIYTYFIGNQRREGHQSFIFSVRELNAGEILEFYSYDTSINNVLTTDEKFNLTSNYKLRLYTSD
jgi:hypothetical protein